MSALFGKRPIVITAELVRALGANQAIVLQQVHWWSTESRKAEDGWVIMSMKNLAASTGLSPDAVKRCLNRLRIDGYIQSEGDARRALSFTITDKAWAIAGAESPHELGRNRPTTGAESPHEAAGTTSRDNGDDKSDDASADFEIFWETFPMRKGRRKDKGETRERWDRLNANDRERALVGARNYALHCEQEDEYAIDPKRFIDAKRKFDEWQEDVAVKAKPMTPEDRARVKYAEQERLRKEEGGW